MKREHPIRSSPEKIEFLEKTTYVSAKNYEIVFSYIFLLYVFFLFLRALELKRFRSLEPL